MPCPSRRHCGVALFHRRSLQCAYLQGFQRTRHRTDNWLDVVHFVIAAAHSMYFLSWEDVVLGNGGGQFHLISAAMTTMMLTGMITTLFWTERMFELDYNYTSIIRVPARSHQGDAVHVCKKNAPPQLPATETALPSEVNAKEKGNSCCSGFFEAYLINCNCGSFSSKRRQSTSAMWVNSMHVWGFRVHPWRCHGGNYLLRRVIVDSKRSTQSTVNHVATKYISLVLSFSWFANGWSGLGNHC